MNGAPKWHLEMPEEVAPHLDTLIDRSINLLQEGFKAVLGGEGVDDHVEVMLWILGMAKTLQSQVHVCARRCGVGEIMEKADEVLSVSIEQGLPLANLSTTRRPN